MFSTVISTVCSKPLAKPAPSLVRTFCKRTIADGGGPPSPTTLSQFMPRFNVRIFLPQHQNVSRRVLRCRPFSSKMAATKDYRLLCLENPLLGKPITPHNLARKLLQRQLAGYQSAPPLRRIQKLNTALTPSYQTSRPSVMKRCLRSTALRPTMPSWRKKSTKASTRTCSTTTTPS